MYIIRQSLLPDICTPAQLIESILLFLVIRKAQLPENIAFPYVCPIPADSERMKRHSARRVRRCLARTKHSVLSYDFQDRERNWTQITQMTLIFLFLSTLIRVICIQLILNPTVLKTIQPQQTQHPQPPHLQSHTPSPAHCGTASCRDCSNGRAAELVRRVIPFPKRRRSRSPECGLHS